MRYRGIGVVEKKGRGLTLKVEKFEFGGRGRKFKRILDTRWMTRRYGGC